MKLSPDALEVYLVRHGESEGNRSGVYQGQADYPLTPLGQDQALLLARHFYSRAVRPSAIYTSPLSRAVETARILAKTLNGPLPEEEDRLKEIDVGPLSRMTPAEALEKWPDEMERFSRGTSLGEMIEGCETWLDVQQRAGDAFEAIRTASPTGTLILVSHAALLVNMHKALLGVPASRRLIFRVPNTGYSRLYLDREMVWLMELAVAPHLQSRIIDESRSGP